MGHHPRAILLFIRVALDFYHGQTVWSTGDKVEKSCELVDRKHK